MVPNPSSVRNLGLGQCLLASAFVIALLFFPQAGANFAWPVVPRLTAVFIGTSFILRALLGFRLWRETEWYRLRWIVWGNYAFLTTIIVATFWHAHQMNWHGNLGLAHLWVIVYVFEPLILPFIEPRGPRTKDPVPPERSEGPVLPGMKAALIATVMATATVGALLFINPEFMDTRWPWALDPFNARIMASWAAGTALWSATMALASDWAEIKLGVQALLLYALALFVAWVVTFPQYDKARENVWTYGLVLAALLALFSFFYWRQEKARTAAVAQALTGHA